MANGISLKVESRQSVSPHIGKQILDVLTSGMYSDPKMAIREYVQNSADSIDSAWAQGLYDKEHHFISITLNGLTRSITVEDNGTGINPSQVPILLGDLGRSRKQFKENRGFRGIGRLGGLAYCDLLRFETRQGPDQQVAILEWDGSALRNQFDNVDSQELIDSAIRRTASFHSRNAERGSDPERFFRVTMANVHRFHSDDLMNVMSLRDYLSQTLPLPYDEKEFPFASAIQRHLGLLKGFRGYRVTLNGGRLLRPYRATFEPREGRSDSIRDVELLELNSEDGRVLCRGWYAHSSFLSALSPSLTMRGIRIRQGNIAVGSDEFLRNFFTEPRFASWHIGELHLSPEFKLNARRDGFEESAEYERFLEWATALCRHLSSLCRRSSTMRSNELRISRLTKEIEELLSIPFFVDEDQLETIFKYATKNLERIRALRMPFNAREVQQRLATYEEKLYSLRQNPVFLEDVIDGRTLRHMNGKQTILQICRRIMDSKHRSHPSAALLLKELVGPFLKKGSVVK